MKKYLFLFLIFGGLLNFTHAKGCEGLEKGFLLIQENCPNNYCGYYYQDFSYHINDNDTRGDCYPVQSIVSQDFENFDILNDKFAKDAMYVYFKAGLILDGDADSFKTRIQRADGTDIVAEDNNCKYAIGEEMSRGMSAVPSYEVVACLPKGDYKPKRSSSSISFKNAGIFPVWTKSANTQIVNTTIGNAGDSSIQQYGKIIAGILVFVVLLRAGIKSNLQKKDSH